MPRRIAIDTPLDCIIRAVGTLDGRWAERLGGLQLRASGCVCPVTELRGRLHDQAALFGVLVTLYNLGLPLLSVDCRAADGPPGREAPRPAERPKARDV